MKEIKDKLITGLEKMIVTPKAVIGISGGIDSAVVSYLTVQAKGKDNVYGIYLPSNSNTEQDKEDAKVMFNFLDLPYHETNIDPIIDSYKNQIKLEGDSLPIGNLKARVRMSILYYVSNIINGMVIGTGNKTEIKIGYFTKYGDGGVDIEPIGDLYKTEVWDLAKEIGIPEQIIDKKPSAGLWKGQTDEDEIGVTYEDIDKILKYIDKNSETGADSLNGYVKVKDLIIKSEHKKENPPIIKVRING